MNSDDFTLPELQSILEAEIAGLDRHCERFTSATYVHPHAVLMANGTYGEQLGWTLLRFPDDWRGGHRLGAAQPIT